MSAERVGLSIALNGELAALGASADDDAGLNSGFTYVFRVRDSRNDGCLSGFSVVNRWLLDFVIGT